MTKQKKILGQVKAQLRLRHYILPTRYIGDNED